MPNVSKPSFHHPSYAEAHQPKRDGCGGKGEESGHCLCSKTKHRANESSIEVIMSTRVTKMRRRIQQPGSRRGKVTHTIKYVVLNLRSNKAPLPGDRDVPLILKTSSERVALAVTLVLVPSTSDSRCLTSPCRLPRSPGSFLLSLLLRVRFLFPPCRPAPQEHHRRDDACGQ